MLEEIKNYISSEYGIEFEMVNEALEYTKDKIRYIFTVYSDSEIKVVVDDEKSIVYGIEKYNGHETIDDILKNNWKLV